MDGGERRAGSPRGRRRRWGRWIALGVLALIVVGVGVQYGPQIGSRLIHLTGSPRETTAYVPFSTPPEVHLAAVGDIGDAGDRLNATAEAVARVDREAPFDTLLLLGDNVYPAGDPERLGDTVFDPFATLLDRGTGLLAILGNHDIKEGHGPAQIEALGMPGRWWAASPDPDVLIVGLDSNTPTDPAQLAFLRDTLSATTATWRIVALHHPPYSAGYQGSSLEAREAFAGVFAEFGVQLVLSGHDHDYQRSEPIDGVVYVVSGAAAGTRRTGRHEYTAVSFSWHHFVDVAVFPDRLVLRAVNQDGRVADEAVLRP